MYRQRFRTLAVAAAITMLTPSVFAQGSEDAGNEPEFTVVKMKCMAMNHEYEKMSAEMPMKIDSMTHLYSASATYDKEADECNANLEYTVDEGKLLRDIVKQSGGEMSLSQATSFFSSDEGLSFIKSMMKEQNESGYKEFDMNGFNMGLTYNMIGKDLPDFDLALFE
jgi:hypothetical protein